jgi:inorganic triphosphatase YgiF
LECIEIEGEGKNTKSLIEITERHRSKKEALTGRKFDFTWAVFDRDSFPADNFDNAINQAEGMKPKIQCAWSNEAFELWYLLHLEFVNTPMSRELYKSKIEKWLSKKIEKPFKYQKNRKDMYDVLNRFGNEKQAIEWAKQLESMFDGNKFSTHNPRTRVYLLIQELNKLIPQKHQPPIR